MTPEERLDRIEMIIERQNQEVEKQNAGIRDLIVVSRTVLTSIQEMKEVHRNDHERVMREIDKLRESQAATDEKLNILIDTVDRIIRHRNGNE